MIPFDFPYPIHPECIPPGDDTAGRYTISFAKDPGELDEVLRLRYQVFNLEMGEGLETSRITQRDLDPFDPTFHHLLIRDNERSQVVGTYRMQTLEMAVSPPDLARAEPRAAQYLEELKKRDPIVLATARVLAEKVLTQKQIDKIYKEAKEEVVAIEKFADDSPIAQPGIEELLAGVYVA